LFEKYDFVAKDVKMDGKVQLIKLQKSENLICRTISGEECFDEEI
jgi:hypothetical protein